MGKQVKYKQGVFTPGAQAAELTEEYKKQQALFDAQPAIVQRFLEVQARQVAEAFTERALRVRFTLPDRITVPDGGLFQVAETVREQTIGRLTDRLARRDLRDLLRQRLTELESSLDQGSALAAGLIRFAAAQHIVHNMLPAGRSVTYRPADEDEEIPTIPVERATDPESAITAETDAIAEEGRAEAGRGSLQVPYVPAARRFYLPQWVAFDDEGKLLVNSASEAEAHIGSMQRFLDVLFGARSLAPYMTVDEEFEKKRYGMLGQLVNQGRALGLFMTQEIITTIKRRASADSLNRGLGLRLPYFDDQDLVMKMHDFVIIPAGRIMFVPAFVVRAAREEQAKVAQDTRLSPSTRKHLLQELVMLEESFESTK